MEDHRLGDLLRDLPREPARPGFTARVLRRLEAAPRRSLVSGRLPRLAVATALAAVLALAADAVLDARRDARARARAEQVLAEIRAEHARLEREVRELPPPPSVIYLGGNEDVDLVLDLGKVRGSEGATPAAYRGETF